MKKILLKLIILSSSCLAITWLLLFSSSSFYGDFNLHYTKEGDDGEYYLNMYKHLPTTPIAVYKLIDGYDKYFWVLYNKEGKEIWHSPYYAYLSDTIGGLVIPTKKSNLLRYSGNKGRETIDLTDEINRVNGNKQENQH
ncbi:DUF6201 family protein [Snodgrassella gandavensis]|uniref:DUF6201 family protein n=1 Tax=Snodgrassella gandavensis TaxID=2946698 RepID=UPI001EF6D589|nr:DUF6201 family protein [Snodgrassella gandavensis]